MIDWLKKLFLNKYMAVLVGGIIGYIGTFAESIGVPSEVVGQFKEAANVVVGAIAAYFITQGFSITKKLVDKKKE